MESKKEMVKRENAEMGIFMYIEEKLEVKKDE